MSDLKPKRRFARSVGFQTCWCLLLILLGSTAASSELLPCRGEAHPELIAEALAEIRRSVDPCGESAEIGAVFETLKRCTQATHRICTDVRANRNAFDRPVEIQNLGHQGVITWNPALRSEIEDSCDGDPRHPIFRDPIASLLHELVHAAQDCLGLNPGEHELEAVRIENIYRRAAGLCQRHSYGDDLLPASMVKVCTAGGCPCSPPLDPDHRLPGEMHMTASQKHSSPTSSGDATQPHGRRRNHSKR